MNDKVYWVWLQQALGYGVNVDEIIGHFGNAKNIYEATPVERALSGAFTKKQLEKLKTTPLTIAVMTIFLNMPLLVSLVLFY